MMENLQIRQFTVMDIRATRGGLVRHLVQLPREQVKRIPEHTLAKATAVNSAELKSGAWIESEGCDVCNTILSHGSFLVSGRNVHDFNLMYSFIAPSFDAYRSIISALESIGLKVKVLRIGKFESKGEILTRKQERTLWLALGTGFYEYPRKVNITELSRKLGTSPSTLSETLRRGIRRLLEHHFETT